MLYFNIKYVKVQPQLNPKFIKYNFNNSIYIVRMAYFNISLSELSSPDPLSDTPVLSQLCISGNTDVANKYY